MKIQNRSDDLADFSRDCWPHVEGFGPQVVEKAPLQNFGKNEKNPKSVAEFI